MKRATVFAVALLCLLGTSLAQANWNADWKQRIRIGLNTASDGVAVTAQVDSVPLLVRLHTGNFPFADAKPDGTDLRVIAADDKTPLKFHIEKFDGLNELAQIWVQLPKLAPGVKNDFIWLYYGNAAAAAADDAKGTYDAAQAAVYHFGSTETLPQDTTANANHAVRSTAKPGASGLIAGGLTFDGSAELVLPAKPSLQAGANGLTLSFWFKPTDLADATLYQPASGSGGLRVSVRGGKLVAQSGAVTATASAAIAAGTWQHIALVVKDGLAIYLGGNEVARAAGSIAPEPAAETVFGRGWKGELDELEIATTARSADWIRAAAQSQGPDQKLIVYGPADGGASESGPNYLKILLGAVTVDGWVVIGILMVMFLMSVYVMFTKTLAVRASARDNDRFKLQFEKLLAGVKTGLQGDAPDSTEKAAAKSYRSSSLYRLYASGMHELRSRFDVYAKSGRAPLLTDQSINAIRATVDASFVREQQKINSQMVLLTICIAGGPFLGLLGTVVGVMITFAAIAAAGDVNVNAIAPGIAAALVATVAGLGVAIPALFGYNYLQTRIKGVGADMHVFVDEFVTKMAENYGG